ncbi:MAG: hypothetical protein ACXVB9_00175 [Bdellovibrionota bacterium]
MKNLLKLTTLAGFCFAMIVFGACGGGSGGGSGAYTVTVNGTAYTAVGSGTFTVTNGMTYYKTGTETDWQLCTQCK